MEPIEARSDARTQAIDATPHQVFAAMCDPQRIARWWGPDGFTSTFHRFQFHPGGSWQLTLHGPDGANHPNEYRLVRIEPDRLLELDHPSDDHHFTLTIELRPQGQGTLVAWQQTFDTVDDYRPLAGILEQANEQVLQRLCAEVRRPSLAASEELPAP